MLESFHLIVIPLWYMFQMAILLELQWTMEFVNTQVLVEAFKIGIWINFTLVWNTNGLLRWNEKQTQQRTRIFSGIFHTLQNLLCILPSTYSSRVILCTKTVMCNECSYANIKFKLHIVFSQNSYYVVLLKFLTILKY